MNRMRKQRTLSRDERGVSEAISYVLIFGLMSLGTAIVVLQGTPLIDSTEERQIDENAERAVLSIQDRVDEMIQQNAPRRQVSVQMNDLTVGVGGGLDNTVVNLTVDTGTEVTSYETSISPVYINTGRRTIAYENGAVLVGQQGIDDSWSIRSDPSWAVSTNDTDYMKTAFVRVISTTGSGAASGDGSARIVFDSVSDTNENIDDVEELRMNITSTRSTAWGSYLSRLNSSLNGSEYTEPAPDKVSLTVEELNGTDGTGSTSYDETVLSAGVRTR